MNDDFMLLFSEQNQRNLIKKTNEYTQQFGLQLTDHEIQELMVQRQSCLSEQQRVEFGPGILEKLIFAFCNSDYIYEENYAETIARLQEIFYLYKNESLDEFTDDELITLMRDAFDGVCQGSLEYLEETYLEEFAREIRSDTHKFIGRYQRNDEEI
ncbi:MAG: DUF6323 family protein [Lachnospiraceae bacterium]